MAWTQSRRICRINWTGSPADFASRTRKTNHRSLNRSRSTTRQPRQFDRTRRQTAPPKQESLSASQQLRIPPRFLRPRASRHFSARHPVFRWTQLRVVRSRPRSEETCDPRTDESMLLGLLRVHASGRNEIHDYRCRFHERSFRFSHRRPQRYFHRSIRS